MYSLAPALIHRRLRHLAQYNKLLGPPSSNYLLIRRRQLVARPHLMKPPALDACLACSGCCTALSLKKAAQALIRVSKTAISLLKLTHPLSARIDMHAGPNRSSSILRSPLRHFHSDRRFAYRLSIISLVSTTAARCL